MWTYWCLQEGTLGVDPNYLPDNEGDMPPVCTSTPTRPCTTIRTARS